MLKQLQTKPPKSKSLQRGDNFTGSQFMADDAAFLNLRRYSARTQDRLKAAILIYQTALLHTTIDEVLVNNESNQLELATEMSALSDYAKQLAQGTYENLSQIDKLIAALSDNWALTRIPLVDKSLLEVAIFEIQHVSDVPASVTIAEIVDVAKSFGSSSDSYKFINGILGQVVAELAEKIRS